MRHWDLLDKRAYLFIFLGRLRLKPTLYINEDMCESSLLFLSALFASLAGIYPARCITDR